MLVTRTCFWLQNYVSHYHQVDYIYSMNLSNRVTFPFLQYVPYHRALLLMLGCSLANTRSITVGFRYKTKYSLDPDIITMWCFASLAPSRPAFFKCMMVLFAFSKCFWRTDQRICSSHGWSYSKCIRCMQSHCRCVGIHFRGSYADPEYYYLSTYIFNSKSQYFPVQVILHIYSGDLGPLLLRWFDFNPMKGG